MKFKKWWHTHDLVPKEIKYPVVIRYNSRGFGQPYVPEDETIGVGTAIYYECSCGHKKVLQMLGIRKIWHDAIIEVRGK